MQSLQHLLMPQVLDIPWKSIKIVKHLTAFATSRGQELLQPYRSHPFGIGRNWADSLLHHSFSYVLIPLDK